MPAGPLRIRWLESRRTSGCGRQEHPEVATGTYAERVLPRIINVVCGLKASDPLRRRVCEGLSSGANPCSTKWNVPPGEKGAPKALAADSLGIAVAA